jgi:hypothetical protein
MFEIEEGGSTRYYYLTRKTDGREFIYQRFYDANLDSFDDLVESDDGKYVSKEEEAEVKRAIREFLHEGEEPVEKEQDTFDRALELSEEDLTYEI